MTTARRKCPTNDLTSDEALTFIMGVQEKKDQKNQKKEENDKCIKAALAQKAKKDRFVAKCKKDKKFDLI
jgi:hypothetical protein